VNLLKLERFYASPVKFIWLAPRDEDCC